MSSPPGSITSTPRQACYFTIMPQTSTVVDGIETPLSPTTMGELTPSAYISHPLLADTSRQPEFSSRHLPSSPPLKAGETPRRTLNGSSFLQLQTHAAHSPVRPSPRPLQNVLLVSDDSDMSPSANSSDSTHSQSSFDTARCSRCQRTPSIDLTTRKNNMIEYGLNLFYCTRCANIVGLGIR